VTERVTTKAELLRAIREHQALSHEAHKELLGRISDIDARVDGIEKQLAFSRGAAWVGAGVLTIVVGGTAWVLDRVLGK